MSEHLAGDRLASPALTPQEEAHVSGCVRCRAERRLLAAPAAPLDPTPAPADRPAPDRFGPYLVEGVLGSGGMGTVFLVRHQILDVRRALKVLSLPGERARERAVREARLQGCVQHPNVLPVLDVLYLQQGPALVLPLVRGPSLGVLLAEHRLDPELALALFGEIVRGVAAIHAAGLIHRDLKPANVLLDASDPAGRVTVKVADFGIARGPELAPSLTGAGADLGTPAYAAPEQRADAASVDARADVWSLGAVLFELLTGTRWAVAGRAGISPIASPWRELLDAMLAVDPASRPSADALLARLPPPAPLVDPELLERCLGLAPSPAAPRSSDLPRGPSGLLPAERDAFVGREAELTALAARFAAGARLVTVLGPGGAGKSRLALRFATVWRGDWSGGAWSCDLAAASTPRELVDIVADTLGLQLRGPDPAELLGSALAERGPCLLLLDNAERAAPSAGELLGRWLDRAPQLAILATSRRPLDLPGEAMLPLGPMLPEEAIELLRQRAGARKAGWGETEAALPDLREIVATLDGLPLAIELAVGRVALMSPRMLRDRLADRLQIRGQGRAERHRTLRDTLDWSCRMLEAPERAALASLAVFEGGASLDAIEAVLDVGAPALDVLQGLVDKSLVQPTGEDRFALLGIVREYAAGLLGDGADRVADRHCAHFAQFGSPDFLVSLRSDVDRRERLSLDIDNLLAASRRAVARGDGAAASATVRAARSVVAVRGSVRAVAEQMERALSVPGSPEPRLHLELSWFYDVLGEPDRARGHAESALAGFRAQGDPAGEAAAEHSLGLLCYLRGDVDAAEPLLRSALARAELAGDRALIGAVTSHLATVETSRGRLDTAVETFQVALAHLRAADDRIGQSTACNGLGAALAAGGRLTEARDAFAEALALFGGRAFSRGRTTSAVNLACVHAELGALDEARALLLEAIAVDRQAGVLRNEGLGVGNLARVDLVVGRLDRAREGFEAALTLHRKTRYTCPQSAWLAGLAEIAAARGEPWAPLADEALALAPHSGPRSVVLATRAALRAREGLLDGAREDIAAALALAPERAEIVATHALVLATAADPGARARIEEVEAKLRACGIAPASVAGRRLGEARARVGPGGA